MKNAVLILVCCLVSCGPTPPKPRPQTAPPGDFCAAAQANLLKLQCQDEGRLLGGPTKRGLSFEAFCAEQIEQGVLTQQDAWCLSRITSCSQVDVECTWGG